MVRGILLAGLLSSAAFAAQAVEGRVLNAATSAPISGAHVRLIAESGSARESRYSATTDAEGRFRFESLPDGVYTAVYGAPGFAPAPQPGEERARISIGSGGEPVRLEAKLQPLGKISGRVLDSSGNPVPNARLWLVQGDQSCKPPECFAFHSQPKANDKGEYEAFNLDPGKWTLSATAPASLHAPASDGDERLGWAQTFYPGGIDLAPGVELWNIDIKLAAKPVHTVRGKLLDASGKPAPKSPVELAPAYGPTLEEQTASDGVFEFTGIVDGQYRLRATVEKLRATQFIEVRRRDVENVDLRLAGPFTLRGKIVMDVPEGVPAPKPAPVDFVLISTEGQLSDNAAAFTTVEHRDGALFAYNVYPGPYLVRPMGDSPVPYYLDSIRIGDRDALGSVNVVSDAEPLTVIYKLGGGTVRGTIERCSAGPVFLIPQDSALRIFVRTTTCDRNGRFEIPAVRPGEYYGVAISGGWRAYMGLLDDAAFLSRSARVTVRASESTSPEIRLAAR